MSNVYNNVKTVGSYAWAGTKLATRYGVKAACLGVGTTAKLGESLCWGGQAVSGLAVLVSTVGLICQGANGEFDGRFNTLPGRFKADFVESCRLLETNPAALDGKSLLPNLTPTEAMACTAVVSFVANGAFELLVSFFGGVGDASFEVMWAV